jgi:hypothetical protein
MSHSASAPVLDGIIAQLISSISDKEKSVRSSCVESLIALGHQHPAHVMSSLCIYLQQARALSLRWLMSFALTLTCHSNGSSCTRFTSACASRLSLAFSRKFTKTPCATAAAPPTPASWKPRACLPRCCSRTPRRMRSRCSSKHSPCQDQSTATMLSRAFFRASQMHRFLLPLFSLPPPLAPLFAAQNSTPTCL